MMAAAAANFWDRGADGMYTWFLEWPLAASARHILTLLAHPQRLAEADKHYFLLRGAPAADEVGFATPLPLQIAASDKGTRHPLPFYISDDLEGRAQRLRRVTLKIRIYDLVSQDGLTFWLNGQSLNGETCLRQYGEPFTPYNHMWLEFDLRRVRPKKGHNLLEIQLDQRVEGLVSPLIVDNVEILVEYGPYPST